MTSRACSASVASFGTGAAATCCRPVPPACNRTPWLWAPREMQAFSAAFRFLRGGMAVFGAYDREPPLQPFWWCRALSCIKICSPWPQTQQASSGKNGKDRFDARCAMPFDRTFTDVLTCAPKHTELEWLPAIFSKRSMPSRHPVLLPSDRMVTDMLTCGPPHIQLEFSQFVATPVGWDSWLYN
jgi:hypothetical protein